MDELSLRRLVWADGLGYLDIDDRPGRYWHLFGPWELAISRSGHHRYMVDMER